MVNPRRLTQLTCGAALLIALTSVAREPSAWQLGDTADQEVVTPVALDVIDVQATNERRAQAALKVPAIFRGYTSVSNTMVVKLTATFAEARSQFLAGLPAVFKQPPLDSATIQSPTFEKFVADFNEANPTTPVTLELAQEWASDLNSAKFETNLIQRMLRVMRSPVSPDELPDGYELGAAIRVVPVRVAKAPLSLAQAEKRGKVIARTNLTNITALRTNFRRSFSSKDQNFARVVANLFHPNCDLDTNLTTEARSRATAQMVVVYHYEAGQTVVQRGQTVDSRVMATLERLQALKALTQTTAPTPKFIPAEPVKPAEANWFSLSPPRPVGLWISVPAVAIGLMGWVFWRQATRRQNRLLPVQAAQTGTPSQLNLPPELAPQLAQILKSAVVQELAAQRKEMLETQHHAATEVVRLMHRLNELHAPLQDRLSAYEKRIQELETELSVRTEENRELLKLKIDLLRQQLETERVPGRTDLN